MVKLFGKLKGSADKGTPTQNNTGFIRVVPEKEEELRRTAEAKIKQASQLSLIHI